MLLTLFSVIAASVNSTLLHKTQPYAKQEVYRFNLYCAVIWCAMLLLFNGGFPELNQDVMFWGSIYGIAQVLFLLFKAKAMAAGPVSVTTLIGNCSLLLSTAVSVMVWKEPLGTGKAVGILLLLFAVFICTYSGSKGNATKRWKAYSIGYFVFSASVGIVFKFFSHSGIGDQANGMMLLASMVMILLLSGISGMDRVQHGRSGSMSLSMGKISPGLVFSCGILSCFYNRLNVYLSGALPGTIFFPVFNGGTVIVSFALGKLVLNEKINQRQVLGLVLGIAAILVIGL